jgi:enolase
MSSGTTDAIGAIRGGEILDSRGRPTVEAVVFLEGGASGRASVPSGASTGRHEAAERRDGHLSRYGGLGVRTVAAGIDAEISSALRGLPASDQEAVDQALIELDGTSDKSRLGANAILAVSLATARAAACARGVELWRHLGGQEPALLPRPMVNMISGGLHASGGLDFQDFLIIPLSARTIDAAMQMSVAIRDALARLLVERGLSTLKADEGGFAPRVDGHDEACALLVRAIEDSGLTPGEDVAIAIDVAASHFFDQESGTYHLRTEDRRLDATGLVDVLEELVERFPIVSIEDPLAEDDWEGWKVASRRLGNRVQLIGDDLFTTNEVRLRGGIEQGVANAILVKMNQIGTLSETLTVVEQAKAAGYGVIASARSGETEDDALADLAIATRAGQIKVGSVAQSERLAKYNRLVRLEQELGARALLACVPSAYHPSSRT